MLGGFDFTRPLLALTGIGCALAAVDQTAQYARDRTAFGSPLAGYEGVSFPLAEHATTLEAARLLCYSALSRSVRPACRTRPRQRCRKWYGPLMASAAVKDCLLLHGHYGYATEVGLEQRLRDVMAVEIADGTAQIQKIIVARERFGREFVPYPKERSMTGPISNRWTRLVGVEHPIVQEGLGPFRTPRLAAAVSNAGGLGTVSMPGMPEDIAAGSRTFREHIEECAALTEHPFAVNIPVGVDANGDVLPFTDAYIRMVLAARAADAALARRLTVLTTSAGFPGDYLDDDQGRRHGPPAQGRLDPAGREGGRGRRRRRDRRRLRDGRPRARRAVHTYVLVPSVTEAVDVPVLLTGGARDGRGLAAALAMGADGVAMGTRFITSSDNSDWHPAYLQALLDAKEGDDVAFDGVYGPCRGLRNAASTELLQRGRSGEPTDAVAETRWKIESMQRAQTDGDVENSLVMTGQVASAIHDLVDVAEFVPRCAQDAADVLRSLVANLVSAAP